MQTLKKIFAMMLTLSALFFIACEDDEIAEMSVEDIKTTIHNMDDNMQSDLDAILEAEGYLGITDLSNMPDPFEQVTKSTKPNGVISNIKESLIPYASAEKSVGEEPFDFDQYVGTYTWMPDLERWNIDLQTQTDYIIINFPLEGSTTNNATLTIYAYTEEQFYDSYLQEYYYEPTRIQADLFIDKMEYIDLDATMEYDSEAYPTLIDIEVYLVPFTFDFYMEESTTTVTVDGSIKLEGITIVGAGITAKEYAGTDDLYEGLETLSGYLRYRIVKITGEADMYDLNKFDETQYETEEEALSALNALVDMKIVHAVTGQHFADIELVMRTVGTEKVLGIDIVYPDGTTEDAMPIITAMGAKMEEFLASVELTLDNNFSF